MRIFVGNLAWATTEEELRQLFHVYGSVEGTKITPHSSGLSGN